MSGEREGELSISSEADIVAVRRCVRDVAASLLFGPTDITRIVTAASELTRNVYNYAGRGVMRWQTLEKGARHGVELTFEDHGPGIPDVEKAMETGYTTGNGLGLGLPGAKRLMDEMDVRSAVGQGTTVTIRKWLPG